MLRRLLTFLLTFLHFLRERMSHACWRKDWQHVCAWQRLDGCVQWLLSRCCSAEQFIPAHSLRWLPVPLILVPKHAHVHKCAHMQRVRIYIVWLSLVSGEAVFNELEARCLPLTVAWEWLINQTALLSCLPTSPYPPPFLPPFPWTSSACTIS